jgi:hypothetical protein
MLESCAANVHLVQVLADRSGDLFPFSAGVEVCAGKHFRGGPEWVAERVSRRLTTGEYLVGRFAIRAAQ